MADWLHAPVLATPDGVVRPTQVIVDLDRLAANYHHIARHTGTAVMPILKANAYGHGLVEVAWRLQAEGAPYLGVAYVEEGIHLREQGITVPILVLGGILGSQIPVFLEHDLTLTASSVDKLQAIERCAASAGRRARVHLKIDTGMERIGQQWDTATALLEAALSSRHVDIEGLFSHFATSDEPDLDFARAQHRRFEQVLDWWTARAPKPRWVHMANSGAVLQLPEARHDLVRAGLLLYGVYPTDGPERPVPVSPALRWVSRVVFFKVLRAGRTVSYGATWSSPVDTRLVTVPVGYGDGYFRAMSGQAQVLIGGERRPVRGRICMDAILADLGPLGTAYNGDEVVLLGEQGDDCITVEELARWAGTIPYEILTNINTRVPRVYLGQTVANAQ